MKSLRLGTWIPTPVSLTPTLTYELKMRIFFRPASCCLLLQLLRLSPAKAAVLPALCCLYGVALACSADTRELARVMAVEQGTPLSPLPGLGRMSAEGTEHDPSVGLF